MSTRFTLRGAAALFVARALARSWLRRPIRLIAAIVAGVGGVMLTTAVLLIGVTVLSALRSAPIKGVAPGIIAVEAQAPGGMSNDLVNRAIVASGARHSSRMVISSTTAETPRGTRPVFVFGVDANLPSVLDKSILRRGIVLGGRNSVYLTRKWAQANGLVKGDTIRVPTPAGVQSWKVVDLIDAEFANGGAVIVGQSRTIGAAFGKTGVSDVVLLSRPVDASAHDRLVRALDGSGVVMAPKRLFSDYNRVFDSALSILGLYAGIAILTSSLVLFLTWRLVLADASPVLSRLKLLGSRTRDIALGAGFVMIPILLITYAIGTVLGLWLGNRLTSFTKLVSNMTGQALHLGFPWLPPVIGSFLGAVAMFAFAWLSGIRRLHRTAAIDAVTGRDQTTLAQSHVRLPAAGAALTLVLGVLLAVFIPDPWKAVAIVPLFAALCLTSALVPVLLGILLRRNSVGPTMLLVGRQLEVGWRRSGVLSIMFAVALGTSVVMSGVSVSMSTSIAESVARWTTVPLLVQAAPLGANFGNETLPAGLGKEIEGLPGVDSTYTYGYTTIGIKGQRFPVWSWGGSTHITDYTNLRVSRGPKNFLDTFTDRIAVSENFARTQRLRIGDALQLPRPDGHKDCPIGAIIDDSASDGGMIVLPDKLYREIVGKNGVYSVGIRPQAGTDEVQLASKVKTFVEHRYPRAIVITAAEMRDGMASITARLVGAFEAFAWVMFFVASIVGAATLASALAERQPAIALVRLVGSRRDAVRRHLVAESLLITLSSWVVAIPIGLLTIPAAIGAVSVKSGLVPPVVTPTPLLVASLPLTLAAIAFALFVARRSSSEVPMAQLMRRE